jgi:hypothetical protein
MTTIKSEAIPMFKVSDRNGVGVRCLLEQATLGSRIVVIRNEAGTTAYPDIKSVERKLAYGGYPMTERLALNYQSAFLPVYVVRSQADKGQYLHTRYACELFQVFPCL